MPGRKFSLSWKDKLYSQILGKCVGDTMNRIDISKGYILNGLNTVKYGFMHTNRIQCH